MELFKVSLYKQIELTNQLANQLNFNFNSNISFSTKSIFFRFTMSILFFYIRISNYNKTRTTQKNTDLYTQQMELASYSTSTQPSITSSATTKKKSFFLTQKLNKQNPKNENKPSLLGCIILVVVFGVIISNSLFLIIINLKSNLKQYSLFGFYINIYIYIIQVCFLSCSKKKEEKVIPQSLFIYFSERFSRQITKYILVYKYIGKIGYKVEFEIETLLNFVLFLFLFHIFILLIKKKYYLLRKYIKW